MSTHSSDKLPYEAPRASLIIGANMPRLPLSVGEIILRIMVVGVAIVIGAIIAFVSALKLGWVQIAC